jgi:hypothetical protein
LPLNASNPLKSDDSEEREFKEKKEKTRRRFKERQGKSKKARILQISSRLPGGGER